MSSFVLSSLAPFCPRTKRPLETGALAKALVVLFPDGLATSQKALQKDFTMCLHTVGGKQRRHPEPKWNTHRACLFHGTSQIFSPPSKILCTSQKEATSTIPSRFRAFSLSGPLRCGRTVRVPTLPLCSHQVRTDPCVLLEGPVTAASGELFRKPLKNIVIALLASELPTHASSVTGANAEQAC